METGFEEAFSSLRLHEPDFEAVHALAHEEVRFDQHTSQHRIGFNLEFKRKVQELQSFRNQIQATRVKAQESRQRLKNNRETLMMNDAQVLQELRVAFPRNSRMQSLLDKFQSVQDQRNEYHTEQDDYEKLEEQLIREEWELKTREKNLFGIGSAHISLLGDEENTIQGNDYAPDEPEESTSDISNGLQSIPDLETELSRLLDRWRALKEELEELKAIRAQYVDEEKKREQVGMEPIEEYQTFLSQGYKEQRGILKEELKKTEDRIGKIDSIFFFDAELQYSQFDGEDLWELPDRLTDPVPTIDPETDPLLLPRYQSSTLPPPPPLFSVLSKQHDLPTFKDMFINEWLLHRLRTSRVELKSYKVLADLKASPNQFKNLVLEWWSKDGASSSQRRAQEVGRSIRGSPALTAESKHVEQITLYSQRPDGQSSGQNQNLDGRPSDLLQGLFAFAPHIQPWEGSRAFALKLS
jgi:hypothetical protein